MPKLQTFRGFVALFEKIYDGEPIITVISNIGEGTLYNMVPLFQVSVWCEKCVEAPDTTLLFENDYCLQIIEIGFAE